jgi:aminoglycoside phosphotransferase
LRERIKEVYKELPRCVIQGDLNQSNILVFQDHFYGLIDFNLSGTEVNINAFCNETNEQLEEDFIHLDTNEYYKKWTLNQEEALDIILKEYELNTLEKNTIYYYRKICQLSMYPNVMAYIYYLDKDLNKAIELLNLIIEKL